MALLRRPARLGDFRERFLREVHGPKAVALDIGKLDGGAVRQRDAQVYSGVGTEAEMRLQSAAGLVALV